MRFDMATHSTLSHDSTLRVSNGKIKSRDIDLRFKQKVAREVRAGACMLEACNNRHLSQRAQSTALMSLSLFITHDEGSSGF
jgi:hypothetical protein